MAKLLQGARRCLQRSPATCSFEPACVDIIGMAHLGYGTLKVTRVRKHMIQPWTTVNLMHYHARVFSNESLESRIFWSF